ncbi:hypothetical protein D9758_008755 [Tetrapyrgos nigripes]|uniref:Peptidase A1 domain-containing protein n=1 Tax=Tetrapyrgos nigripes TaxID=182062 RepID=A0A8H5D5M0_9AGAR|nr:hypothetical protein D9758_008755 [Tetrapyrgos nigripes]
MFSPSLSQLSLLLLLSSNAFAAPSPSSSSGSSMKLHRRARHAKTAEEWGAWAKSNRDTLIAKYGGGGGGSVSKRSSGTNLLVNQNADSSFYGSIAVGTPPVSYSVVLDTGSADLWLADKDCSGCNNIPRFDYSASSTFKNTSVPFSIKYGSGAAAGTLGQDTVQMAGFSVESQVFAVCNQISDGLLDDPVSGLLGLGFETIAASKAPPFWESLVKNGAWDQPLMSFQLTRMQNVSSATELEAGGTFTMGFTDSSLFTGDIDYNNIPDGMETYWIQQMSSLTSQGSSISLSTATQYAAIDTGTTLVGGPSSVISQIFAQVEGAQPATGNYEGYYTFPCDTDVTVTMAFGGKSWTVSPDDFRVAEISRGECLGGFFELDTGTETPSWIVGDTFLKNVYSVFRYNPPSVGFAQLSSTALQMNSGNEPVPSATIGSVAAGVTAAGGSGGSTQATNGAVSMKMTRGEGMMMMMIIPVVVGLLSLGALVPLA